MKKKGFTLIELLAVIVILAIIALIAVPLIMNVIDKAKKGAFLDTAYGILNSADYYYTTKVLVGQTHFEGLTFDFSKDVSSLEFKGEKPKTGFLAIYQNGETAMAISNGTWCAKKGREATEVYLERTDDCALDDPQVPSYLQDHFSEESAGENGGYQKKYQHFFFTGADPNNWVKFHQKLWRVVRVDSEGIKIIYEQDCPNHVCTGDGKIAVTKWNHAGSNVWNHDDNAIQPILSTWFTEQHFDEKFLAPVTWCIGAIRWLDPTTTEQLLAGECVNNGAYSGKTTTATAYGMIQASDYANTSNASTCTGSYQYSGNNSGYDCSYYPDGTKTNFLYTGYAYWMMNADTRNQSLVWSTAGINPGPGGGAFGSNAASNEFGIRPVLNLKLDIPYQDGDGTLANPFVIG